MTAHKQNPIQYSSQEIDNESYNDAYKIRETAIYGYNADSDAFLPLTNSQDYRFSGGKSAYAAVLNTAGANTVITPSSGKRIRIFWVAFVPNSDNASANLVTVSIGSTPIYTGYALAHWEVFTGAANDTVKVNLANTGSVAVTIHYQEIT